MSLSACMLVLYCSLYFYHSRSRSVHWTVLCGADSLTDSCPEARLRTVSLYSLVNSWVADVCHIVVYHGPFPLCTWRCSYHELPTLHVVCAMSLLSLSVCWFVVPSLYIMLCVLNRVGSSFLIYVMARLVRLPNWLVHTAGWFDWKRAQVWLYAKSSVTHHILYNMHVIHTSCVQHVYIALYLSLSPSLSMYIYI